MMTKSIVRWQDGSHDTQRTCKCCGTTTCPRPYYDMFYREIGVKDFDDLEGTASHENDDAILDDSDD